MSLDSKVRKLFEKIGVGDDDSKYVYLLKCLYIVPLAIIYEIGASVAFVFSELYNEYKARY